MTLPHREAASVSRIPLHANGSEGSMMDLRRPDPPADAPSWWVIHLPVQVSDVQAAIALADAVARVAAAHHPPVLAESTTVSPETNQTMKFFVYCGKYLSAGGRCELLARHGDDCGPRTK